MQGTQEKHWWTPGEVTSKRYAGKNWMLPHITDMHEGKWNTSMLRSGRQQDEDEEEEELLVNSES